MGDPDLQIREGDKGRGPSHPDPEIRLGGGGRGVSKTIFSAIRASVLSKNKGGPGPPPLNPPLPLLSSHQALDTLNSLDSIPEYDKETALRDSN